MNHIARPSSVKLPRTYYVGNLPIDMQLKVRWAADDWNKIYPCFKEVLTPQADVTFAFADRTWVRMPSETDPNSTVYLGDDANLDYWMPHELGHTMGFADHVSAGTPLDGYINPGRCPDDYIGIMSYCTAKHLWFSQDDKQMLMRAFPLKRRIRIPFISR